MRKLRIAAISFLNTAPLMWDFEHTPLGREFEIISTVPSECAEMLRTGAADIGIVPVVSYATIPGLRVIPQVAIATKGSVRSILLVSKLPLEEIRTVAADTSSRTSVALARVLFRKWLGGGRQFTSMPPQLDTMLQACDAALIIGDPALTVDRRRYVCYDLAEEWETPDRPLLRLRLLGSACLRFGGNRSRPAQDLSAVARSRIVERRHARARVGTAGRP